MGTGLPGLQQGRWTFAETGPIILYSTRLSHVTVIETSTGSWGITPADPEAFAKALADGQAGRFEPVFVMGFGRLLPFLLLSLGLPVAAIQAA